MCYIAEKSTMSPEWKFQIINVCERGTYTLNVTCEQHWSCTRPHNSRFPRLCIILKSAGPNKKMQKSSNTSTRQMHQRHGSIQVSEEQVPVQKSASENVVRWQILGQSVCSPDNIDRPLCAAALHSTHWQSFAASQSSACGCEMLDMLGQIQPSGRNLLRTLLQKNVQIASANNNITQQQQLQTTASSRQNQTATSIARRAPTSVTTDYKSTNNISGHDGTSRIIGCSNRINEYAKTHDKEKDIQDSAGFQTAFPTLIHMIIKSIVSWTLENVTV